MSAAPDLDLIVLLQKMEVGFVFLWLTLLDGVEPAASAAQVTRVASFFF